MVVKCFCKVFVIFLKKILPNNSGEVCPPFAHQLYRIYPNLTEQEKQKARFLGLFIRLIPVKSGIERR